MDTLKGEVDFEAITLMENKGTKKLPIEIVRCTAKYYPRDDSRMIELKEKHVEVYFEFKNNTSKTITGLIYRVKFLDSFNTIVYKTQIKDELMLKPKGENSKVKCKMWLDKVFIVDEPFDYLIDPIICKTLKVKLKILKVAYIDSTIETF